MLFRSVQLSVTVPAAAIAAASFGNEVGLHPKSIDTVGQEVNSGGVSSYMLISCVQLLLLPLQSYTYHVRVKVFGQVPLTEPSWYFTVEIPQLSEAVPLFGEPLNTE